MKKMKYVILLLAIFILIAILIAKNINPMKQISPNQNLNAKCYVPVNDIFKDSNKTHKVIIRLSKPKYYVKNITTFRNAILLHNLNSKKFVKKLNVVGDTIPHQDLKPKDFVKTYKVVEDSIQSKFKTYTNDKYGFTFQYPDTWTIYGEDTNRGDRFGTLVAVNINFIDTSTNTTLLIEYHLAPNGVELYKYALSQFNSSLGWYETGGKQIEVEGNTAVVAFTTINIDGKGNALTPPLRLILVDFLDKQKQGSVELQFKTPLLKDEIEVAKFERLLSTFKFTN